MERIVLNVLVRQGIELLHVNEVDFQRIRQKTVPVGIFPEMEYGMKSFRGFNLCITIPPAFHYYHTIRLHILLLLFMCISRYNGQQRGGFDFSKAAVYEIT